MKVREKLRKDIRDCLWRVGVFLFFMTAMILMPYFKTIHASYGRSKEAVILLLGFGAILFSVETILLLISH